jgi:hypothetical protein
MFEPKFEPMCVPLLDRELDALDAEWRPLGLVAAVLVGGSRMAAAIERHLDWRDYGPPKRVGTRRKRKGRSAEKGRFRWELGR